MSWEWIKPPWAAQRIGNLRPPNSVDERVQGDSVFAVSATLPAAEAEQRQANGPALLLRPARGEEFELRAIAAVTQEAFHSPQGGDATDADKPKKRE
jgi:hypothetical protein